MAVVPSLVILAGLVMLFTWGCFNYMKGKGYSQWLGLLGLLPIIGLIIMVWLPDKQRRYKSTRLLWTTRLFWIYVFLAFVLYFASTERMKQIYYIGQGYIVQRPPDPRFGPQELSLASMVFLTSLQGAFAGLMIDLVRMLPKPLTSRTVSLISGPLLLVLLPFLIIIIDIFIASMLEAIVGLPYIMTIGLLLGLPLGVVSGGLVDLVDWLWLRLSRAEEIVSSGTSAIPELELAQDMDTATSLIAGSEMEETIMGLSADGQRVFFVTKQSLLPSEIIDLRKAIQQRRVQLKHHLFQMPTYPVFVVKVTFLDRPNDSFGLETFLDIDKPDKMILQRLTMGKRLGICFHFFDSTESLSFSAGYESTIRPNRRLEKDIVKADVYLNSLPSSVRSYPAAVQQLIRENA